MLYTIQDTEDRTLGEMVDYVKGELRKTNLEMDNIVVEKPLRTKLAIMELQRIFDDNGIVDSVEFDSAGMYLTHTQNYIEFSENELEARFSDIFGRIIHQLTNI